MDKVGRYRIERRLGAGSFAIKARVQLLRDIGAPISPFNAFLILQGIETLALRMDRINANTLAVAKYLQAHPKVAWVNYAGLPDHPEHALAQKYLRDGGASGLFTFGVKSAPGDDARYTLACLALIAAGVALIYLPAGLIAAGLMGLGLTHLAAAGELAPPQTKPKPADGR